MKALNAFFTDMGFYIMAQLGSKVLYSVITNSPVMKSGQSGNSCRRQYSEKIGLTYILTKTILFPVCCYDSIQHLVHTTFINHWRDHLGVSEGTFPFPLTNKGLSHSPYVHVKKFDVR